MLKALTHISRLVVGILFIISGLIKLNDPMGFSFKLEEYFSPAVLDINFLAPYALGIAVFMVILEVILGVMLLLGFKKKFTLWALLATIVFFTFLTFYSAYFNKVTDCGCFGDAIKLTPWQSFSKDVVLLILIVILLAGKNFIRPIFSNKTNLILTLISCVGCGILGYYVLNHLPLIDFRAYKVGTNVAEAMRIPEDAPKAEYEMIFIYKVNGQVKEYSLADLSQLPKGAEFVDRKEKLIKEGFVPKIQNFSIERDGEDYTHAVLNELKMVLVITYDLEKASRKGLDQIEKVHQMAKDNGYKIIGLTATSPDTAAPILAAHNITVPYFLTDGVALKTIERANPSFVVMIKGQIVEKVHWKDIDKLIF